MFYLPKLPIKHSNQITSMTVIVILIMIIIRFWIGTNKHPVWINVLIFFLIPEL